MIRSRGRRALWAMAFVLPALLLIGCSAVSADGADSGVEASGQDADAEAWVVVMFESRPEEFDANLMDLLLDTEMAADAALAAADAGRIDGNDVGGYGYELYFVGDDAEAMWTALEPVFAAAPVAWTRVELRDGLEDASPRVLEQDS